MLRADVKCEIEIPVELSTNKKPIEKVDIFEGQAFLLKNIFSPEECHYLINKSEEIGYLENLFDRRFRTNDRIQVESDVLADLVFERIKPFLPPTITIGGGDSALLWEGSRLQSKEFDEGTWELVGLNNNWRFCKYSQGGYFTPHRDGSYIESANNRSILTFNLYLNETTGGTTNFLEGMGGLDKNVPKKIRHAVAPEPGTALVFVHWLLHEGDVLESDLKYLVRTDIMYKRISPADAKFCEAFSLVQQAEALESMKQYDEAVKLYRRAFKLRPELEDMV